MGVGAFMFLLCVVLGAVMTYVAIKVYRLVWATDRIIPCMLLMMCCCLYSLGLFFLFFNILLETVWIEQGCEVPAPLWYAVVTPYLILLPSYFLGVGAMLNLNKWCYFLMRILAFVRIGRALHQFDLSYEAKTRDSDSIR